LPVKDIGGLWCLACTLEDFTRQSSELIVESENAILLK